MESKHKIAIEEYQCSGCVCGNDTECYEQSDNNIGCNKHCAGTTLMPGGRIFLGMPKGFNKVGPRGNELKIQIFDKYDDMWEMDYLNVPIWKHLDKNGNTIIKGLSPRIMYPFLFVILENCLDKITCHELTKENLALILQDFTSSLYLSIISIAELTQTHIRPNNHNCAGKLNGNPDIINSMNAQINKNGITDNTKNGCLKFQKCKTKTENIRIIQIPNAFIKSVIEFCISATSQAYSK